MTDSDLAVWAPYNLTAWWPATGNPVLTHLPTGHRYRLVGVALLENDVTPCAVYHRLETPPRPFPVWARPLVEVLEGPNWEWAPTDNPTMSDLSRVLRGFTERSSP